MNQYELWWLEHNIAKLEIFQGFEPLQTKDAASSSRHWLPQTILMAYIFWLFLSNFKKKKDEKNCKEFFFGLVDWLIGCHCRSDNRVHFLGEVRRMNIENHFTKMQVVIAFRTLNSRRFTIK